MDVQSLENKTYRVAILSDSHGEIPESALQVIRGCDRIIHAGDFCSSYLARKLDGMAMMYMVRGNNDMFIPYGELETLMFQIGQVNFFIAHNRNTVHPDQIPPETDVVIFGHTHQYDLHQEQGRTYLNPGSVSLPRFSREQTMAVMTITGKEFNIKKIVL